MITFSENQQKIVNALEAVNCAHWIDNHNGTISCSYCHTWVYKDNRYSYFRYCPYCGKKMEDKQAIDTTVKDTKTMGNTNDRCYDRKTIKGADLVEIKTILADFEKALNRLSECVKRASNDNFIWNSGQDKEVNTIDIPKNATNGDMIKTMFPCTCKDCKHRPVDDGGSIEPPYDVENRRLDETCPCINKADWGYSYVPEDDFFCAYVERGESNDTGTIERCK